MPKAIPARKALISGQLSEKSDVKQKIASRSKETGLIWEWVFKIWLLVLYQVLIPVFEGWENSGDIQIPIAAGMTSFIIVHSKYGREPLLDAVNGLLV